jgi:Domain of unknown function (DUF927)/Primase C terminal 2 (PriCT-2)
MELSQARTHLAKVLPWPQEGDEPAFANIHWTFVPENLETGRKPPWTGRAVKSLDEAVRTVQFALNNKNTRDIYVCLSTQREAQERVSQKGFKYCVPIRNQDNAVALKALWIDIDAYKPGPTGYASQPEAMAALGAFLKATSLPRPSVMVQSGGGVHVYWTLDRALTRQDWEPLAFALAEAIRRHDLHCDIGCTTDSARVLRIPQTFNRKQDTPRPVVMGTPLDFDYSLDNIRKLLLPYAVPVPQANGFKVDTSLFKPRALPPGDWEDLSAGLETKMPQADIAACLKAIPNNKTDWQWWNNIGMRIYAACGGDDYGLEEWEKWSLTNAQAGGADSCVSRWETYHHSPPTRTGAGALVMEARAATGDASWLPPPASGLAVSASAPSSVTSPGNDLPKGYKRNANNIILRLVVQEDGTTVEIPVFNYPITDAWLEVAEPSWVLHFETFTYRKQKISLNTAIIGYADMRKVLQSQGVMLHAGTEKVVGEFMVAFVEQLKQIRDKVTATFPFGWNEYNGKIDGFVFAGSVWSSGAPRPAPSPGVALEKAYTPKGERQPWFEAIKLVTNQSNQPLNAVIASSFAAPLIRFTGKSGVALAVYSTDSGVGKSTAIKVAQSVWGSYKRGCMMLNDTNVKMGLHTGKTRSLPVYWDEMQTDDNVKDYARLIFQLTQGREKGRGTQSLAIRESGEWQTMMVSAANQSLIDVIAGLTKSTTAGIYRVFECEAFKSDKGVINSATADILAAKLENNYGHVGTEYAQFLGANFDMVEEQVQKYFEALVEEVEDHRDERFWTAMMASLLMGIRYSNQLGFTEIDEEVLKAYLISQLGEHRKFRDKQPVDMKDAMNVVNVLAQYINAMRARHTLRTNRINISPGKPKPGYIKVLSDVSRLDAIYVHRGVEDKIIRISSTHFTEWCKELGHKRNNITSGLEREFGMKLVRGHIGSGTDLAGPKEYLLEIQYAGTKLSDLIEEQ